MLKNGAAFWHEQVDLVSKSNKKIAVTKLFGLNIQLMSNFNDMANMKKSEQKGCLFPLYFVL